MSDAVKVYDRNAINTNSISDIALPETFDDVLAIFGGIQNIPNAADVLADEWEEVDKARLVNVPFVIVTWNISDPDTSENGQYVIVRGMTAQGKRFRFTDGSTGVKSQLMALSEARLKNGDKGINAGLYCPTGLRKSDYKTKDADGKAIDATTFYINNVI